MTEFVVIEGLLKEFHINDERRLVRGYGPDLRGTPVLKGIFDTECRRAWVRLEAPDEPSPHNILSELSRRREPGRNTVICTADIAEDAERHFRRHPWSINPEGCDLSLVSSYGRRIRSILRAITRWEHDEGRLYHLSTWNTLLQDISHVVFPLKLTSTQRPIQAALVQRLEESLSVLEPGAPVRQASALDVVTTASRERIPSPGAGAAGHSWKGEGEPTEESVDNEVRPISCPEKDGSESVWVTKRAQFDAAARRLCLQSGMTMEDARGLVAVLLNVETWAELQTTLSALAGHDEWWGAQVAVDDASSEKQEREARLLDTECVASLFHAQSPENEGSDFEELRRRFLRKTYPPVSHCHADLEQLTFMYRVWYALWSSLDDTTAHGHWTTFFELPATWLDRVCEWHADGADTTTAQFGLPRDDEQRAAWHAAELLQRSPSYTGRKADWGHWNWMTVAEVQARLQNAREWALSYRQKDEAGIALVLQACYGADARVLVSERGRSRGRPGLVVEAVVCQPEQAANLRSAGWSQKGEPLLSELRLNIERNTWPLTQGANWVVFM